MGSSPSPSPPNWSDIDKWIKTAHPAASDEGPAALLSHAEIHTLIDNAVVQSEHLTANWFAEHWPDCLVFVVIALLLGCVAFQRIRLAPLDQVTVAVRGGLAPFHVITDSDLVLRKLPPRHGALLRRDQVRGRYLLQYAAEGSVLHEAQLSRARDWDQRLKQLLITELPVRIGRAEPSREAAVIIVAAKRGSREPAGVLLEDVPLLGLTRTGREAWATVALSRDQLNRLRPYLGNSDLLLVRPSQ
jgi:hypothetical protein